MMRTPTEKPRRGDFAQAIPAVTPTERETEHLVLATVGRNPSTPGPVRRRMLLAARFEIETCSGPRSAQCRETIDPDCRVPQRTNGEAEPAAANAMDTAAAIRTATIERGARDIGR